MSANPYLKAQYAAARYSHHCLWVVWDANGVIDAGRIFAMEIGG